MKNLKLGVSGEFKVVMQQHELVGLLIKSGEEKLVVILDLERNELMPVPFKVYEADNGKTQALIVAENENQARELLVEKVKLYNEVYPKFDENEMTVEEAKTIELRIMDPEEPYEHESLDAEQTVAGYLCVNPEPYCEL